MQQVYRILFALTIYIIHNTPLLEGTETACSFELRLSLFHIQERSLDCQLSIQILTIAQDTNARPMHKACSFASWQGRRK
jgi:hypothetical protein